MSLVQCNACGGVYTAVGRDGVPYAHVCGPVHLAQVRRADASTAIVSLDQVQKTDTVIADVFAERSNKRDENPQRNAPPVNGKIPIVSDGAGVSPVAAPTPIVVAVPGVGTVTSVEPVSTAPTMTTETAIAP